MPSSAPKQASSLHLDATSKAIIFEGATITQLGTLFKMGADEVKRKIQGVTPCGTRGSSVLYDVADVVRKMGSPLTIKQVDAAMKRINPRDLPKLVLKEYWNGLRAKQAYEANEGDTWPTDKVIEEVSELVKTLSMELNLLSDAVHRTHELTEAQRALIIDLIDGSKKNMVERVKSRFVKKPKRNYEAPKIPADSPSSSDEEEL